MTYSPVPLLQTNIPTPFEIGNEPIQEGNGEYFIFSSNGAPVQKEIFERAYQIINEQAPLILASATQPSAITKSLFENRYAIIRDKIKQIDATLEVNFIPRTLYELFFVRQCIQEDLDHNSLCPIYYNTLLYGPEDQSMARKERNCWHIDYFRDGGKNAHKNPLVQDVAYRLNQMMVEHFTPTNQGFTFQDFIELTNEQISFFKTHYLQELPFSSEASGPTITFNQKARKDQMGIEGDHHAQVIQYSLALDCSTLAKNCLFLYRGSKFQNDAVLKEDAKGQICPHSLSYGTSLLAGCLYDAGATVFQCMRSTQNLHIIPIPFDQIHQCPFYIPAANPIAQLFGKGEFFHGRSMAWQGVDMKTLLGIMSTQPEKRRYLQSKLTKEEFFAQFERYKNQSMQLTYLSDTQRLNRVTLSRSGASCSETKEPPKSEQSSQSQVTTSSQSIAADLPSLTIHFDQESA